ncbi:MAG TPA: valine--tRNA ligase, partial [Rhodobacteraceae bacterium]|nr:valine--tRNA ligase [Paracoccaceae bacterium]
GPALDAVRNGNTEILPERDKKVYFHWLENIEPWCISRQLWWGHQIPVWFDAEGNQYCAATQAEAQAQAGPYVPLTRDPDVLDTWFSSGLWPIGTLGWPENTEALRKYFPTSVLITGFDIIFFWVARMMMMQYAVMGEKPFSTVYVHALVRDEKGKKMSKSLGNVLDPLELIDAYGADAVRFTLTAMAAMGRDLKLSTQRIAGYRNFGTKLWNAARFAEMNEVYATLDPAGKSQLPAQLQQTLNKWIVGETAKVREAVDAA